MLRRQPIVEGEHTNSCPHGQSGDQITVGAVRTEHVAAAVQVQQHAFVALVRREPPCGHVADLDRLDPDSVP